MRLAEIGDPIVVAAADFRKELGIRDAVPEQALTWLQHRAPDAILLVLDQHCIGVVSALADIFPKAEEIDLRGVLEALPGLHHRAQRADLHAVEHPGVEVAAGRSLAPFHARRAVTEFRGDPGCVHVRWLDDVRIRRDQLVRRHYELLRCCRVFYPPSKQAAGTQNRIPSTRKESSDHPIPETPSAPANGVGSAISANQCPACGGATGGFALD